MSLRKIGVEEELMLVDTGTGELTAVSQKAVRAHEQGSDQVAVGVGLEAQEPGVEQELFLQQIETTTTPCGSVDALAEEIRLGRRAVERLPKLSVLRRWRCPRRCWWTPSRT